MLTIGPLRMAATLALTLKIRAEMRSWRRQSTPQLAACNPTLLAALSLAETGLSINQDQAVLNVRCWGNGACTYLILARASVHMPYVGPCQFIQDGLI